MKKLPFVAMLPLLFAVQPIGAQAQSSVLEKRCSEQERQIKQLEEENGRLRSMLETSSKIDAPKKTVDSAAKPSSSVLPPVAKPTNPVPAPTASAKKSAYYTVAQGDNLSRIARKHDTTPELLAKLNNLKDVALIRPGQKLKLPQTAPAVASRPAPETKISEKVVSGPAVRAGTHTVKEGETFFGIARKYGLSVETLTAANPKVNPRALRIGQSLQLVPESVSHSVAKAEPTPAPKSEPALAPAERNSSKPVSNQPKIRSVRIDKEINFGDFAAAHSMEPAKLNALNGLHLESNVVLAKGSELYVSAQP